MNIAITQHNLFAPKPSKGETKADVTSGVARAIVGAETELRAIKTARLMQARKEAEAMRPVCPAPSKPRRAKSTVAAGARSRS